MSGPAGFVSLAWPGCLTWLGWAIAVAASTCAAVGLWHHRCDAARVARCAHELRGPLGALRLGLELALARSGLTRERIQALELQLARASAALDDLNATRSPVAPGAVDLWELARDCVAGLAPLAADAGVSVWLEPTGRGSITVWGDRARLAQALGNLIQNAIEHGQGPVRVRAGRGARAARIEVLDQGPGLDRPLDDLRHRGRGRGHGWAAATQLHGHGISVASSVAAAHGGALLSAPSDHGARLVLELPLRPTPAIAPVGPVGLRP